MFQINAKVLMLDGSISTHNVYGNDYDYYIDGGGNNKIWVRMEFGQEYNFSQFPE